MTSVTGHAWLAVGAVVLGTTACGSTNDAPARTAPGGISETVLRSYEGLYQLDSYSRNSDSCDSEGPSVLTTINDPAFVLGYAGSALDKVLVLASCTDASDCQSKAATIANAQPFAAEYSVTLTHELGPDALEGAWVSSGFPQEDVCVARVYQAFELTRAGDTVRVERRSYTLADEPARSDGTCVASAVAEQREAESAPCALVVFSGTRTAELP